VAIIRAFPAYTVSALRAEERSVVLHMIATLAPGQKGG